MAVSVINRTSGIDESGSSSSTTAAVSLNPNRLILATVAARTNLSTNTNTPTLTGAGLTWVIIADVLFDTTSASRKRVTVFRAMGASPTGGVLTIDYGGQTQTSIIWVVDEFSGMDTTGTNGSGAIAQVATNSDGSALHSTITATLGAFTSTNNATYGAMAADGNPPASPTPGTGFAQVGTAADTTDGVVICTQFEATNNTSVPITWSKNVDMGAVAVEIVAGAGIIPNPNPNYDHVIFIAMENHHYSSIIGNTTDCPYINNTLLPLATSLSHMSPITSNGLSLPSYLGWLSGSLQGQTTDFNIGPPDHHAEFSATNLVDKLEAASISWKGYMEAMPVDWYTKSGRTMGDTGEYAERHNPFAYFSDINDTNSNTRLTKVVPYTQLATDLAVAGGTGLPQFVWITPQLNHDMHDANGSTNSARAGDNWLLTEIPKILNSDAYKLQKTCIIIGWDDGGDSGLIPTLIFGSGINANTSSSAVYTNYSILATIELIFGLSPLTTNDANAAVFSTDVFSTAGGSTTTTTTSTGTSLLQEDGSFLLQETGDKILLESGAATTTTSTSSTTLAPTPPGSTTIAQTPAPPPPPTPVPTTTGSQLSFFLQQETGYYILQETGDRIILEDAPATSPPNPVIPPNPDNSPTPPNPPNPPVAPGTEVLNFSFRVDRGDRQGAL